MSGEWKRSVSHRITPRLYCVIQSTYELGVEAAFWKHGMPEPEPDSKAIDVTTLVEDEAIDAYAWV